MGGEGSGIYDPQRAKLSKRCLTRRRRNWLDRLDGRSSLGRALRYKRQALHDHLGGEPSVVESDLIDRYLHVGLLIGQLEDRLREGDSEFDPAAYLAATDRLVRLASAIGLSRRARDVGGVEGWLAARTENASDGA